MWIKGLFLIRTFVMAIITMKTELMDNTLTIDRRSFLQGIGIATVGLVTVKVTGGSKYSGLQALSGTTQGKMNLKLVRRPRKPNMAHSKKVKSRAAQVV